MISLVTGNYSKYPHGRATSASQTPIKIMTKGDTEAQMSILHFWVYRTFLFALEKNIFVVIIYFSFCFQ